MQNNSNTQITIEYMDRLCYELGRPPLEVRYDLEASSAVNHIFASCELEPDHSMFQLARRWIARKICSNPYSIRVSDLLERIDTDAAELFATGKRTDDGGILGVML